MVIWVQLPLLIICQNRNKRNQKFQYTEFDFDEFCNCFLVMFYNPYKADIRFCPVCNAIFSYNLHKGAFSRDFLFRSNTSIFGILYCVFFMPGIKSF